MNYMELAQGDHGRSGGQYDIWAAVFGPVGADGYPKPIFDKVTGVIDPSVAAYWRDHYDLSHIIERDWAKLGPELEGKIHIYYNYQYLRAILERIKAAAPRGADLASWRY